MLTARAQSKFQHRLSQRPKMFTVPQRINSTSTAIHRCFNSTLSSPKNLSSSVFQPQTKEPQSIGVSTPPDLSPSVELQSKGPQSIGVSTPVHKTSVHRCFTSSPSYLNSSPKPQSIGVSTPVQRTSVHRCFIQSERPQSIGA